MAFKDFVQSIFINDDQEVEDYAFDDDLAASPEAADALAREDFETEEDVQMADQAKKTNQKLIRMDGGRQASQQTIQIFLPRIFGEAERIGDLLLEGKGVILNFDRMDDADARRFIDYIAGVVFAIHGDMQRIGQDVFLAVPATIDIQGVYEDQVDPSHSRYESDRRYDPFKEEQDIHD
ncbi:cell division protein SepF [Aerococcus sanguinicola]|uniref:cell division protein SepF n=1 Tax=Aerococcus sanguinicola TaxID=119206 RepID=UPI0018A73589|nr:cell division protein SepF [Aerococcus sanguinicola]